MERAHYEVDEKNLAWGVIDWFLTHARRGANQMRIGARRRA